MSGRWRAVEGNDHHLHHQSICQWQSLLEGIIDIEMEMIIDIEREIIDIIGRSTTKTALHQHLIIDPRKKRPLQEETSQDEVVKIEIITRFHRDITIHHRAPRVIAIIPHQRLDITTNPHHLIHIEDEIPFHTHCILVEPWCIYRLNLSIFKKFKAKNFKKDSRNSQSINQSSYCKYL